jgi:hypothetical protein
MFGTPASVTIRHCLFAINLQLDVVPEFFVLQQLMRPKKLLAQHRRRGKFRKISENFPLSELSLIFWRPQLR